MPCQLSQQSVEYRTSRDFRCTVRVSNCPRFRYLSELTWTSSLDDWGSHLRILDKGGDTLVGLSVVVFEFRVGFTTILILGGWPTTWLH